MKIRRDFVTNSSSSSYVCEICGNSEFGFDLSISDCDMCECENGHIFCREHMRNATRKEMIDLLLSTGFYNDVTDDNDIYYTKEELEKYTDEELFEIINYDCYYSLPECFCPICSFEEISRIDLANYLYTKYGVDKDEVLNYIKEGNRRRKKIYDYEYIAYVVNKYNLNIGSIQSLWKNQYGSYSEFQKSIKKYF